MSVYPRQAAEAGWGRGRELDGLAGLRMEEAEPGRVEAEAADRVARAAVEAVADDRMAQLGELDAELVAPSGPEAQLEERRVGPACHHPVVRDGGPAGLGVAPDAQPLVLDEPGGQRAGVGADPALDDGGVDAPGAPLLELGLEVALGPGGRGEDQETGRFPVEAVDDERAARRPPRRQVLPQEVVDGALPLALRRDG